LDRGDWEVPFGGLLGKKRKTKQEQGGGVRQAKEDRLYIPREEGPRCFQAKKKERGSSRRVRVLQKREFLLGERRLVIKGMKSSLHGLLRE